MVLSLGRCPISCIVGGLLALGCGGNTFTLSGLDMPKAETAAVSGSPAPPISADWVASGAGAPAPVAGAAAGYEGPVAGRTGSAAGVLAQAGVSGSSGSSGSSGMAAGAGSAGAAGSTSRWQRRGSSGGAGADADAGAAAEGGTGGSGRAGRGGSRAGAGGAEADGCVQNLACQLAARPSTGDAHQDCVDRINQFRQECACLPPLERWAEGEDCADEMAKYDSVGSEAHAAFGAGICAGGSAQNECPGWRSEEQIVSVCLQQMWDEGPPPMSDCSGSCFQTYGHFLNMTNQRMTKVACGFYAPEDGQVWSVQNFAR